MSSGFDNLEKYFKGFLKEVPGLNIETVTRVIKSGCGI